MYTKTNWVDNETPVNAENMNKLKLHLKHMTQPLKVNLKSRKQTARRDRFYLSAQTGN